MKKTTLYFIWLPQILFFLVCNACIWDQKRTHFDLSTISSQDLIKLAENIKPNPTVSLEGIGNIPYTVLSPDGKRMAKVERLRSGIESQVYVLSIFTIGEASGIKIAEVVNFFGLCWSPGGSKIAFSEGTINKILKTRLKADGITGEKTRKAVKAFQRKYGLQVDGVAGSITKAKIREILSV